jgi:hypothetical protein
LANKGLGVNMDKIITFWMMACRDLLQQSFKPSMEFLDRFILMFPKGFQPGKEHARVFLDAPSLEKGFL